jgi:hypothetical protein
MKLAEQLESTLETVRTDEDMSSNDDFRITLKDGHHVYVGVSLRISKYHNPNEDSMDDYIEKQANLKSLIKDDIEAFNKSVAAKLKAANKA